MICKVAKHQEKFWSILTQYGALNDKVRTSDLEPYYGIVDVNFEEFSKAKPISLKRQQLSNLQIQALLIR